MASMYGVQTVLDKEPCMILDESRDGLKEFFVCDISLGSSCICLWSFMTKLGPIMVYEIWPGQGW